MTDGRAAALECLEIHAAYDDGREVLHGVSLGVTPGEVMLLIGPNGAGKSTILRTVSGLTTLLQGRVRVNGKDVSGAVPERVAHAGVAHVLQGRTAIPFLSVRENLRLGGYGLSEKVIDEGVGDIFNSMPTVRALADRAAGTLSGGQQQLVELARALIRRPSVVMVDEPSLGLSPRACADVLAMIRHIADNGVAVLMVEQKVRQAFEVADTVVILRQGAVVMGPLPRRSVALDEIRHVYMGSTVDSA